ncbi:MAG: hypothetical protein PHS49_07735 [Candidatus Gracilibacteria bacterium]|nr:hypothetical protein [Candidatus Gracilibacteria bacterium]
MPVTTNNDSIQQTLEQSEAKNELSGNIQKDKGLVHGEAILGMKNLIADISKNPFALSQKQGEQYAQSDEIMSDTNSVDGASKASNGGGGIDSSNNLATINKQIQQTKAKIKSIEEKGDQVTTQDKREKYALNKQIIELKELQRAELIKKEDETTEEVIKKEDETTEEVIKKEDETTEEVIKKYDDEFIRKQKIINKGIKDLQSMIK